jgi:DNA (cytosine-5)-methyltransferase 1
MNYLSVCSGVEAATVAWHHMGWNPVGFGEIEKFPSQVLAHHYPNVTNFGDMTKYKEWKIDGTIGLLVGGTPCQSFSVAGLRKGLEDPRGNLALTYVGILDHFRPKWFIWENVPGVLSSGGGRDFGSFLGALGELGYGWSYRVLDAQYFGVAQRRRRVFVVGCLGNWRPTAEVLFESESLRRDIKKGRKKGETTTSFTASSFGNYCEGVGTIRANGGDLGGGSETLYVPNIANCLQTTCDDYSRADGFNMVAYSIREGAKADNFSATPLKVTPALQALRPSVQSHHAQTFVAQSIGFTQCDAARDAGQNISPTLRFGGDGGYPAHSVAYGIPGNWIGRKPENGGNATSPMNNVAPCLTKTDMHGVAYSFDSLASNSMKSSNPHSGCRKVELSKTIDTTYPCPSKNQGGIGIMQSMAVRRLTPVECERLQGFPDNYTNIKENCPDGPRYKAMGNSMAVPVMRWIGERINKVNNEQ